MGKPTGFIEYNRELPSKRPVEDRVKDYREFYEPFEVERLREQGARCMDCGVPFCHSGCPLGNIIPDWNDLVYRGLWKEALDRLQATNNFPEFTGRICPAPCEEACVLGINEPPVTIEHIEKSIVEHGFEHGMIHPEPPAVRTGKTVAVIGSGPSGLACAQQLNRAGHTVTVYERADRIGGLLRYGIPDFKLEKWVIDRRLKIMEEEGITFRTNANVGVDIDATELRQQYDAVVLTGGSTKPRDLPVPGRDLKGVQFAMDFLSQNNKRVAGDSVDTKIDEYRNQTARPFPGVLNAKGKHVIVIGGGDTGSDCIGTSNRHGAKSVTNFELFPKPLPDRPEGQPWPFWPMRLRTSTSHDEGCQRRWAIMTKEFKGKDGKLTHLVTVDLQFTPNPNGGPPRMTEVAGSEKEWRADLVTLALGFVGPEPEGMISQLGVELDNRGNVKTNNHQTTVDNVFAAGDMRRGQSLVVWAISEGRECAHYVDTYLMGSSELPSKGDGDLPRV